MPKTTVVLHSALDRAAAVEALARSIDWEHRSLFSLAGYNGNRALIGQIFASTFRIHRRRYWRNDFAPHFYGSISPESTGGTRVEGYFDVSPWVRSFMRIWLAAVVLFGGSIFVLTLIDMFAGTHFTTGDAWIGIAVAPVMVGFGLLLPRIGRLFSEGDETLIVEQLQTVLAAQKQDSPPLT
jgi:hypothetical protein